MGTLVLTSLLEDLGSVVSERLPGELIVRKVLVKNPVGEHQLGERTLESATQPACGLETSATKEMNLPGVVPSTPQAAQLQSGKFACLVAGLFCFVLFCFALFCWFDVVLLVSLFVSVVLFCVVLCLVWFDFAWFSVA